ncbi:MAG: PQQ-binding-like beta-propeller repeat protein [Planctomycetaceae bacterium]
MRMRSASSLFSLMATVGVLAGVSCGVNSYGDDWPQFLGVHRDGVSKETGLVKKFGAKGPAVLWQTDLGVGMSGISVVGSQVFTLYQDETSQYVVCLGVEDGKITWKTAVGSAYENAMGNGPRATPSVSGDNVYALTGEGILVALKRTDGMKLWEVNVPKSLGGEPSEYGMSGSPLVVEKHVIVHAGTESAAVAAFDAATGKLSWKAGSGKAGYSSPVLAELSGVPQVLAFTATGITSVDPASGTEFWSFPFITDYDCNTANPVTTDDGHVLISAGENHGSVLLNIAKSGNKWTVKDEWTSAGKDSQLRAEWQTPVLHDGYLYGLDNSGSAGPITNLVCIRLSDRKTMWQKSRFGKSNLILADGMLWLTTMNGELVCVEAKSDDFFETGRATVMETTRQAPAISNGRLFVRDDVRIICFDVKSP